MSALALPSADEIEASILRDSLRDFIISAWPLVEPGTELSMNWHIEVVCERLQAATRGDTKRLILNVPPRSMKSYTVSVFWPAWVWLTRPEARFMFATYSKDLSVEHAENFRVVIGAEPLDDDEDPEGRTLLERVGYRGLLNLLGDDWGLAGDQVMKVRNDRRGVRFATSTGAKVTGFGGDYQICDDPHNAEDVHSDVMREKVLRWWDQSMASRLNSQKTGVRIVVMQRLHEQDLTGHLVDKGGWEHICLPMQYDPAHPHAWPDDPRTEHGELLWPERWGPQETESLRQDHDPYAWAGQYQQLPAPAEGGIFKTAWWQYYPAAWLRVDPDEHQDDPHRGWEGPHFTRLWQSWDTALKEKTSNDYSVGQLWAQFGPDRYLLRQVRGRWNLPDMITEAVNLHTWATARFPGLSQAVFVENTANGPELIAALRRKVQGVIPVNADRDKVSRAHAVLPQISGGNVYLPGRPRMTSNGPAPDPTGQDGCPGWVIDMVAECAAFPNAAHDDQVDALTQALDPRRWTAGGQRRRDHGHSVSSRLTGAR